MLLHQCFRPLIMKLELGILDKFFWLIFFFNNGGIIIIIILTKVKKGAMRD